MKNALTSKYCQNSWIYCEIIFRHKIRVVSSFYVSDNKQLIAKGDKSAYN